MSYKKFLYYTFITCIFLVLLISGRHLAMVIITAAGLWYGREIAKEEKEIADEIKTGSRQQAKLMEKREELAERFKWMQESSKQRREGNYKIILLFIPLLLFGTGTAGIALAAGDLYIPESYEELRELYIMADREVRERDELLAEYQALVEDYEKSLQELTGLVNRLQEINREKDLLIAVKEKTIAACTRSAWGINCGLAVGEKTGYVLGIARRQGWWGWFMNYSSPGSVAFGLSVFF